MALDPLASLADLAALGLVVAVDEQAIATRYLAVGSAAIREAAGVPISQTTSTVDLTGTPEQWLTLPGPPVISVATVLLDGDAITDWRLRSHRLWRACGWQSDCGPSQVTVTQTHGLATVPDDIIDLNCRMAAAALADYRADEENAGLPAVDIRSERIGDYAVTYGSEGLISTMQLPDWERERLAARFGGNVEMVQSR